MLDRNSAEAMLNELVTAKQIGGKPANTAADELIRTIDPKAAAAAEAQKAMRALTNPTAPPGPASVPPPDSAPAPSYRPGDKRELDRLLGTQR